MVVENRFQETRRGLPEIYLEMTNRLGTGMFRARTSDGMRSTYVTSHLGPPRRITEAERILQ